MNQPKLIRPRHLITKKPNGKVYHNYYGPAPKHSLGPRITEAEYLSICAEWDARPKPAPVVQPAIRRLSGLADAPILSVNAKVSEAAYEDPTIADLIVIWRRSTNWARLATATRLSYELALGSVAMAPLYPLKANSVETRHIYRIAEAIAAGDGKRIYAGASNRFVGTVSAMWGFGAKHCRLTVANPAAAIKRRGHKHYRPWSDAEINLVLAQGSETMRRYVTLALHCAQRRSDVVTLTWSQYDPATVTLRLVPRKTAASFQPGETLVIPVPGLAQPLAAWRKEAIARRLASGRGGDGLAHETILTGYRGERMTGAGIMSTWYRERARLGLPADLHLHGLRCTSASRMIMAGLSTRAAMALTGHKSEQSFAGYVAMYERERNSLAASKTLIANLPASAGGSG